MTQIYKYKDEAEHETSQKAALIINTKARRGQELFAQAQTALKSAGIKLLSSHPVIDGRQIAPLTRDLVKSGIKTLIVGGGDGTISTIVDYLAGTDINLGLLPLGTGNDLATTLNIPLDIEAAARIIAAGRTTKIDLGIVNNNYYVNNAGVGLGTAIVAQTSNENKRAYGSVAFALTATQTVMNYRSFVARLTFSNQVVTTPAINITVSNGRYFGGGNLVNTNAQIDDNELIVTIFEPMNLNELIQVGTLLRSGQYTRHPRVRVFRQVRGLKLEIVKGNQQHLYVDGELWGHTPANFSIASSALKVLVP